MSTQYVTVSVRHETHQRLRETVSWLKDNIDSRATIAESAEEAIDLWIERIERKYRRKAVEK